MVIMSLKLLQLPCRCCCAFQCADKTKCRPESSLHNRELPMMETVNDGGAIEPLAIENTEPTRGRSKKRGKGKKRSTNKEPFSHIAPGVLPFAAVASASPNAVKYIRKSRSPSPIATAVTFAGRIGKMIAAGEKLERSLSERDIYSRSGPELAQSKQMSKSLPGPSTFLDQAAMDMEAEAGYEIVGDVRGRAIALLQSQPERDDNQDDSQVMKRGALPLPDEGSDAKEDEADVSDLYAKVVRHGTVKSKLGEHRQELADDSDDLTTVTEEDEETLSKTSVFKTKMKYQATLSDDFIDGSNDRSAYRLPFDAITSDHYPRRQIEPIEELENQDLSDKNSNGIISPASAREKEDPSRASTGLPSQHRSRSAQDADSEHSMSDLGHHTPEELSSRSSSPRELGREAALRRLEELGFDGISKEFGIFPPSDQDHHGNYERLLRKVPDEEEVILPIASQTDESTPLFDNFGHRGRSESPAERMASPSSGSRAQAKSNKMPSVVVEEPEIKSVALPEQQSSQELMLGDLIDDRQKGEFANETVSPRAAKFIDMSDSSKNSSVLPMEIKSSVQLMTSPSTDGQHDVRSQSNISQSSQREVTGKRTFEERGSTSRPNSISPRQAQNISGHPEESFRRNSPYDSRIFQKQMHEEIQQKQDKILSKISSLQEKFDSVAKSTVSDKMEAEDEEKLLLLRKLIKEEQKKYHEQQKILEEQEEKFLKAQERMSVRKQLSSSPIPHEKHSDGRRPKSTFLEEPSHHARVLGNRLANVEAERKALLDLNSSLQDENNTLRKLAFDSEIGDASGIVMKKQNAELIENNTNLKSLVHRLNVELSRYQAKYRPPRREEVDGLSLPEHGPIPEWLVNMKYLSPLIMAYDDRLKEKSDVIRAYEANLASIKARMLEIVRENQRLHLVNSDSSNDDGAVDANEWNLLQENARLVVEENTILMQEIDLKDRRIDEMQEEFDLEIDKLTKKVRLLSNEARNAQKTVSSLQIDNEALMKRCKEAEIECSMKITEEEAERRIENIRRPLLEQIQNFEKHIDLTEKRCQAVVREKQELAVKLTDSNAIGAQLRIERDLVKKSRRILERNLIMLQRKFESAREREFIATDTLAQVLSVAEKNSSERDEFARLIETQNNETMRNYKQLIEEERKLDQMRKEIEKYKNLAKRNAAEVEARVREKDEEIASLQKSFDKDLSSLRDIIRSKQRVVELFQSNIREVDIEIDGLCHSVTEENKEFKALNK